MGTKKPKTTGCRQFFGKFDDAKAFLRDEFALGRPVRVSRLNLKDAGDCDLINGHFYIRIDRKLCEDVAILILFHEWSHALSWKDTRRHDHGQAWGKAYSKVWSRWVGER